MEDRDQWDMEEVLREEVRQDLVCAGPRIDIFDLCHVIVTRAECMGLDAALTRLACYAQERINREIDRRYPL
jgi:hypothetical protein